VGANGNGPNGGNGLYDYTVTSRFPTSSFRGENYWVDVVFAPAAPPGAVSGVSATAGTGSATVSWSAPTSGGPPTSYKVTPYVGGVAQAAKTVSGSPPATSTTVGGLTAGQSYTFTVQAVNASGAGPESAPSNAITPSGATVPGAPTAVSATPASGAAQVSWSAPADDGGSAITAYTVTPYTGAGAQTPVTVGGSTTTTKVTGLTNGTAYTFKVSATNAIGTGPDSAASSPVTPQATIFDLATPAVTDTADPNPVEVGVKFTADTAGSITGIRFYKAAANTGTHVANLWTASGTRLVSATFTNETASGWQQVNFATPVAITANTTYVASYFAPNGHYSNTAPGFTTAVDNPPLHAPATSTTPNGVYAYGPGGTFPTDTYLKSNYWVDVVLQ
jgi:hypothetical protein